MPSKNVDDSSSPSADAVAALVAGDPVPPTSTRALRPALVLAILSTASFLALLDVWITNVGLQSIGRGVHAHSLSDISWVLNGYAIVYAALLVPAGRLADRFGRRAAFLLGLGIFGAASIGAGLSGDVWVLVGFRVLTAIGAAALTPSSLGLVLVTAPKEKLQAYVKVWFTSGALAATSGPVIGGLLVNVSWRLLFLINVPIVIAAVAATLIFIPKARQERGLDFPDVAGGLIFTLSIGALSLGIIEGSSWGWSSARVVGSFIVAVLAFALFLVRSAHHRAPVVRLDLFRERTFRAGNLVVFLTNLSFGIMLLSAILWMQGHWGYSPVRTGLATAPGPVMFAIGAGLGEVLNTKRGIRVGRFAPVGFFLAGVGVLYLVLRADVHPSYLTTFLPGWLVIGTGFGLAGPAAISAAEQDLNPEDASTGSGVVSMSLQLGSVIGVSVLVAILGAASAGASKSTYQHAWIVSICVALATIPIATFLDRRNATGRA